MIKDESIRKLFDEYEKAFAALDTSKSAESFADTFISAGPRGVIAQNKVEFLKLSYQAADFYKNVGQTSARILSADEIPISNEYSMIKVHWGVTFKKTRDKLIEFDVTYIVQKTSPDPKIIMFIAHQDEQKAMQELGLISK
jgi:hypothetical protein